jgi:hypothetical protein
MADHVELSVEPRSEPRDPAPTHPPRAEPGSRYAVLFVRRRPRLVATTFGPIRHDPGAITFQRDYLELEGVGVQYEGWRAARIVVPTVIVLPGVIGTLLTYLMLRHVRVLPPSVAISAVIIVAIGLAAVAAYFLAEYAFARPMRIVVPLIHVRRVILDPLRGTVMLGVAPRPGGTTTWHSFATAYAWAIFDGLEPLLEPGACTLITRRDRALARSDLAVFLAMCSLMPVLGVLTAVAGICAGLLAALMGQRRRGLLAAASCLIPLVGQVFLIRWWITF